MKLPIWHVLLWTLFCLSVYLLLSCFLCLNVLRERSLCPVSVLRCLPLPTRPSCAVFVHINQGAVPLHSKLNMRPKALKSALEGDTLKCSWTQGVWQKLKIMPFCHIRCLIGLILCSVMRNGNILWRNVLSHAQSTHGSKSLCRTLKIVGWCLPVD